MCPLSRGKESFIRVDPRSQCGGPRIGTALLVLLYVTFLRIQKQATKIGREQPWSGAFQKIVWCIIVLNFVLNVADAEIVGMMREEEKDEDSSLVRHGRNLKASRHLLILPRGFTSVVV